MVILVGSGIVDIEAYDFVAVELVLFEVYVKIDVVSLGLDV